MLGEHEDKEIPRGRTRRLGGPGGGEKFGDESWADGEEGPRAHPREEAHERRVARSVPMGLREELLRESRGRGGARERTRRAAAIA